MKHEFGFFKKNQLFNKLAAAAILLCSMTAMGQDNNTDFHTVTIKIPEVALLDLESASAKNFNLAPTAPTEAGDPLDFSKATDSRLWLNYSSIIGSTTEAERKVTVQVTNGDIPGGVELKVKAAAATATGAGTYGTPAASAVSITTAAADIITGVKSVYTGHGVSKGHNLTYSLELASGGYADLDFDDSQTVTVTYTLSDN